ncbi:hypothetical protein P153DRAFT_357199 [Dothidotthia symphoricarpi CBS 119687]|uniref:Uncharacterized protein n=1 Tax=Dothidotthia symphoricarpi CBS 119687 TaxID=1392245 RepID=A0A6A6AD11_9PLEO|nr:uncharacterized protein P153DRAFT_357199 [Dothidotthia symphoricarpi CBS 119687]KAF2129660.1 hypothetical protein P153DRAFT_357199 [Dothidotthia symphoricarpi CBS 119687]
MQWKIADRWSIAAAVAVVAAANVAAAALFFLTRLLIRPPQCTVLFDVCVFRCIFVVLSAVSWLCRDVGFSKLTAERDGSRTEAIVWGVYLRTRLLRRARSSRLTACLPILAHVVYLEQPFNSVSVDLSHLPPNDGVALCRVHVLMPVLGLHTKLTPNIDKQAEFCAISKGRVFPLSPAPG